MRKTREEKAITLIALIITIVVLLILAVVAINAVTGDGIIQHATNAKTEYEKAQAEENTMISYYQTYLDTEGQVGKWVQNKTSLSKLNEDGTVDKLEVGDIVDYKKEDGSKYTDSKGNVITWAILGIENGKILLVSTSNVEKVKMTGKADYINNIGITKLNDVGKEYDDGIGAIQNSGRSIKVEDVDRLTGYNPLKTGTGEIYYNTITGKVSQYLNKVTFELRKDETDADADGNTDEYLIYYSSDLASGPSIYPHFIDEFGNELEQGKTVIVEANAYQYYPTSLTQDQNNKTVNGISEDSKAYTLLFGQPNDYYWLANTRVAVLKGHVNYSMFLLGLGMVSYYSICDSLNNDSPFEAGVRAVVTLDSNVQLKSAGDSSWEIIV